MKKGFFLFLIFCLVSLSAQAGILMRIMGINPSEVEIQKVSLMTYLPKEIKPEHIIDRGDLELIYDSQQGSYYVFGEYELQPGEVIEREVELADIWVVPEREIETIRLEADKTFEILKDTQFKERADFLIKSINSKLSEITGKQEASLSDPQKHISEYRDNLRLMESVKEDLQLARSLLAQAKPLPTVSVWKLFLIIVGFLGVLALTLYIVWQKQLKVITDTNLAGDDEFEDESAGPALHEVEDKKDTESDDIDKIMRGE